MITPAWRIRDAVDVDMPLIRELFAEEGFTDLTDPTGIRVAATPDNTMLGACRSEQGSDGHWNIRPVVVFDVVQHHGVGASLLRDALKRHPDMYLVSRGEIEPFYLACGFERCSWEEIAPEFQNECAQCADRASCGPIPFKAKDVDLTLTFLGTSSGCGVPAFFCHCPSCEAARENPALRRTCTGVVLRGRGTTLIDTPPDLRAQLVREDVHDIDEVFLTHAHYDHLGGFGELEYLIRLYQDRPMPFHASAPAMNEVFKEFSYMDDIFAIDYLEEFDTRTVSDGLTIQALPLNHCPGAMGYLITSSSGKRTFYAPDTAELKPDVIRLLKGVDNLIMDSTFWGEAGNFKTHHSMQQTIDEGINLLDAGAIYLTHLAPHICEPDENVIDELYAYVKQFEGRVIVAEDGMKVPLS